MTSRTFVVFPKWKKGAIYKVQFVNNDKKYAEVEVQANKSAGQAMPTNPSKSGYTFKEWNTSKDGKGEKFAADTIVKDNMTVYAIYSENKPEQQPKPTKSEEPGKEPTIMTGTTDTTSTEGSTPTTVKPRVAKTGESGGAIGTFSLLILLFAALKSKKLD